MNGLANLIGSIYYTRAERHRYPAKGLIGCIKRRAVWNLLS